MKRIICFLTAFIMLMTVTAQADILDELFVPYMSGEESCEFMIDIDPDFVDTWELPSYITDHVNVKELVRELSNTKCVADVKYNANKDNTKIQASYEVYTSVPVRINRKLKLTGEMMCGMWLDYDVSDKENKKINIILDLPITEKYHDIDVIAFMEDEDIECDAAIDFVNKILSKENMERLKDIYRKNSTITSKGLKHTIIMDKEQLYNIVVEASELYKEDILNITGDYSDIYEDEQFKTALDSIKETMTIEIVQNKDKTIEKETVKINIGFDSLDDMTFKYSVTGEVTFKNLNKDVKVDIPVTTEENAIFIKSIGDFGEDYSYYWDRDWDGEDCPHYEYAYIYAAYNAPISDIFYSCLDKLTDEFNEYRNDDEKYVINKDGDDVSMNVDGREISFKIGSDKLYINGEETTMLAPAVYNKKEIWVDYMAATNIFNASLERAYISINNNNYCESWKRKSPYCHHTEEEIGKSDEYEYDEYEDLGDYRYLYNYCCIQSDMPYNGIEYIPLREIVHSLYGYDEERYTLEYENGKITLTDLEGREIYKKVIINIGDSKANIDGEVYDVENPAVLYNDKTYVDCSLMEKLFDATAINKELNYYFQYMDERGKYDGAMFFGVTILRNTTIIKG